MSINLLTEPLKSAPGIVDAAVLATKTQALYTFQRNDWFDDILSVDRTIGVNNEFQIDNAELTDFSVNDTLYIKSIPSKAIDDFFLITSVTQPGGVGTDVFVRTDDLGLDALGNNSQLEIFNNNTNRVNYRVKININNLLIVGFIEFSLFFTPTQRGFLSIDLAESTNSIILTSDRYGVFDNQFSEQWDNSGVLSATFLTQIWAIAAKRQILSEFGSNMLDFLLYRNGSIREGKPLTKNIDGGKKHYINNVAGNFKAFTTLIDYLQDPDFTTRIPQPVTHKVELLDVNKSVLATSATVAFSGNGIEQFELNDALLQSIWDADTKFLRTVVTGNDALEYIVPYIILVEEICETAIMIEWINSVGGTEQNLFTFNQEVENITDVGITILPPITEDIATVSEAIDRLVINDSQRITCFQDHLTHNQLQVFHSMKHSDEVRVWLDTQGTSKVKVIVEDTYSTAYTTRGRLGAFEVKIRMPDNFDFFEAVDYSSVGL